MAVEAIDAGEEEGGLPIHGEDVALVSVTLPGEMTKSTDRKQRLVICIGGSFGQNKENYRYKVQVSHLYR